MAETFHQFPLLPFELREEIWKHAVRPAQPGAHYFSIYDPNQIDHAVNFRTDFEADFPSQHDCAVEQLEQPPVLVKEAMPNMSWTAHNPSAYLIDYGLWTACKESREVIEKAFKSRKCIEPQFPTSHSGVSSTAAFSSKGRADDNGTTGRCYLTVFHNQDLFIIHPEPDLRTMMDRSITLKLPLNLGTPIPCSLLHWDKPNLRPVHVAFEFHPQWRGCRLSGHPRRPDQAVLGVARQVLDRLHSTLPHSHTSYVWFIDYQIERKGPDCMVAEDEASRPCDPMPLVFYARDRRFVEVMRCQEEGNTERSVIRNEGFDQYEPGGALQILSMLAFMQVHWGRRSPIPPVLRWGLLACEDLNL
ncbi:hypothetical protein QBC34DRAFT_42342 [Podospora aff. communis PSN243]|uniref:2EXR domain-containing protein n=1 Tax=Podospora aff. communis PSN243 TaxID=3040156 RepID=A0AAV9GV83_9PEZI|nr:hypothetical protein QBC34DRAFT_42342 [Podospora aff. communis PSN243]